MSLTPPPGAPLHLVFMGVSGSGKSTIAEAVRDRLGWEFAEGDDFHPPENVAKMHEGIPLTDVDRWGWLESLADWTKVPTARDVRSPSAAVTVTVRLTSAPTSGSGASKRASTCCWKSPQR